MYVLTESPNPRLPASAVWNAAARATCSVNAARAMLVSTFVVGGTGSVLDVNRVDAWRHLLEAQAPIRVEIKTDVDLLDDRVDLRSAAAHLANIREVLNPAIADLAAVLGVSRQAVYKWISGDSTPEADKLERIVSLSQAADVVKNAGIARASSLLKTKAFDGKSLLDLVAAGKLSASHVQTLVAESRAMSRAYDRSGLSRSKAPPSDAWRSEVSIPGSPE